MKHITGFLVALFCALALALAGCGMRTEGSMSGPRTWPSFQGPPVAAEGAFAPFSPEVLVVRIGPFDEAADIETVDLGGAPGWGCDAPLVVPVGAWASDELEPSGDPTARLAPLPVLATRDLGNGFSMRTVASSLHVDDGEYAFVALGLDHPASCGAKAGRPVTAWRWRAGAWSELDGQTAVELKGY